MIFRIPSTSARPPAWCYSCPVEDTTTTGSTVLTEGAANTFRVFQILADARGPNQGVDEQPRKPAPDVDELQRIVSQFEIGLVAARFYSEDAWRASALGRDGDVAVQILPLIASIYDYACANFAAIRADQANAERVPWLRRSLELLGEFVEFLEQVADVRALAALSEDDRAVISAEDLDAFDRDEIE